MDVKSSGTATACMYVGVLAGSLVGGYVSDLILRRTGSLRWARQGVAFFSLGFCGTCIGTSYFVHSPEVAIFLISVGAFCSGVGGPAAYAVTIDVSGRHVVTVFGVMNTVGNLGAAAFAQFLPSLLLKSSAGKWDLVIWVFGLLYVIAAACWIFIEPGAKVFADSTEREPSNSSS